MKPQLLRRIATAFTALGMAWPAIAADMPLKGALLPPPAPVYGWGGYYFGGNVGYSWGKEDLNLNGFAMDGVWIPGNDFAALRPHGTVAGGQVGFNWQTGIVVFGLESDMQWTYQKDTVNSAGSFSATGWTTQDCFGDASTPCLLAGSGTNTLTTKINWFGTLRGRFGLAADQFLFYGTGGLAYGRVQTAGFAVFNATFSDFSGSGPCAVACPASGSAAYADSATRLGWSAGAGVEAAVPFVGNWTWRAEYLFVDFGTITTTTAYSSSVSIPALTLTQIASASVWHSARVTDNIVRFGLNYRFDGGAPILASY